MQLDTAKNYKPRCASRKTTATISTKQPPLAATSVLHPWMMLPPLCGEGRLSKPLSAASSHCSGVRAAPGTQPLSGQLPGKGKSLTFPQRSPGCQGLYKTQEEIPPVPKGNLKQIQGRPERTQ